METERAKEVKSGLSKYMGCFMVLFWMQQRENNLRCNGALLTYYGITSGEGGFGYVLFVEGLLFALRPILPVLPWVAAISGFFACHGFALNPNDWRSPPG